ncbi:MAG: TonB-dependent receptor domain-containing protein [Saprospiraceae bacterium]
MQNFRLAPFFRQIILPALGLLTCWSLQAQIPGGVRPGGMNPAQMNIARFYGKVVDDATGKGIGYASVQLTAMRFDSTTRQRREMVVGGQLTRENGDFSIENLSPMGDYTLKINYLGYEAYQQKVSFGFAMGAGMGQNGRPNLGAVDKDLGNIRLKISTEVLKEVTITSEAQQFSLALDKKIYRPDKDAVTAGGTGEDALKNVPSVIVDIDGNITLRNAAPQIFVDGRPSPLTPDQIPADAIESIEVITNPSAKYDASGGGGGIINIVLKKERRIGYNGNIRAGVDMRGRANLGGDINAREGKLNGFLAGNYNQRKSIRNAETNRQNFFGDPFTNVLQENYSVNTGFFAFARGGLDWFIDNRNTLTFSGSFTGGNFNNAEDIDINNDSLFVGGIRQSSIQRDVDNKRWFRNIGSQISYKRLFPKEGKEWTADVNLNRIRSGNDGFFRNEYFNSPLSETRQRQETEGGSDYGTFQTDLVSPIDAKRKIETGARAAIRNYRSDNINSQYDFTSEAYQRVFGFADSYGFLDQVYAGYINYNHSFEKWGFQTGLRAESSVYRGRLFETDSTFGNQYPLSLFPSVFVTYKINDNDNIQANFSRRINRPSFFQLIPFPDFSDSLLVSRGNPELLPEFTTLAEMSYQKIFNRNHNLLATIYYRRTTDLITGYQFAEFNEELQRNTIVSSFANSNSSTAYGLEATIKNTFGKKFELTSNANVYNSIVDATNVEANLRNEQFSWFVKENLNIRLKNNLTFQLSGTYQSRAAISIGGGRRGGGGGGWFGGPSSTAQGFTIPQWFVDLSARKEFWDRKASLTLSVQDVFRSRFNGSNTSSVIFIQETRNIRDPQFFRLNFAYRFGKFDVSLFRRKNLRMEEIDMGM